MYEDERYNVIVSKISNGTVTLCRKDALFYLDYCNTHAVTPAIVHIDAAATPSRTDIDRNRYDVLIRRLDAGRSIESTDFRFLQRYCKRTGMEMPRLESKLMFWKIGAEP